MREGKRKDRGSMTEEMGRKRERREEDLIGRDKEDLSTTFYRVGVSSI